MNPALSLVTMAMMKKFNKDGTWIWNTYQCYLKANILNCLFIFLEQIIVLSFQFEYFLKKETLSNSPIFRLSLSGVQVSPVRSSATVQQWGLLSGGQAGTRSLHGQREEAGRERGSSGPHPPVLGGHQWQVDKRQRPLITTRHPR